MGKAAAWFEEAQRMFVQEGLTLAEIGRRLDVSSTSLSKWKADGAWDDLRRKYLASERHFSQCLQELKLKLIGKALDTLDKDDIYALAKIMAASNPYAQRELKKLEKDEQQRPNMSPEEKKQLLDQVLEEQYGIRRG